MIYNFTLLPQYDKKLKIKEQDFLGFSKKALKKHCACNPAIMVGEVKKEKNIKGTNLFVVGHEQHSVKPLGTYSKLFNSKAGYVCVGGNNYVTVFKSRLPFLIILVTLLAGITIGGYMLWSILTGADVPVISPNHPLPDVDASIEEIENDTSSKPEQSDNGGSVSMIYSLKADITLADNSIDILFKNPQKSNHDVLLQLYITKDGERTLIAESGRIPAGNMLRQMTLKSDAAVLTEGVYDGVFKVIYYNPTTGERAIVESDITDVEITVKN